MVVYGVVLTPFFVALRRHTRGAGDWISPQKMGIFGDVPSGEPT